MTFPRTVTFWLAALTALFSVFAGLGAAGAAAGTLGFIPARVSGFIMVPGAVPVALTPLTATFVHGGYLHLGFNLLMLVWCGLAIERILGRGPVIFVYVVSAYAAMAAQWAADTASFSPVIGASGAISGLIGAYALSFGRPRRIVANLGVNRWLNIVWLAIAWAVLQWLVGWAAGQQGVLLATPAHIGGFIAGLLMQRPLLLWRYRRA